MTAPPLEAPAEAAARPPRPKRPPVPRHVVLRQRRRRRRTIIGLTVLLVVVNLLVGSTVAYVRWRLGQVRRVKVPGLAEDASGQVMNVLLVGSDSRAGLTGDAAAQAGQVDGRRSDTIMVLHVDPARKRAAILSIPRDLYLPIAGTGHSDKVNAAYSLGGAPELIATLRDGLGLPINHYAEVDFTGFKDIVDAIGGVTVYVPAVARDAFSGLRVGTPGCFHLDGIAALAWVRSRHYEYLSDGKWVADPRGDIGRIQRQQELIRGLLKKAVSSGKSNPLTLNRLIGIGVGNLTIDSTMSSGDIARVGRHFTSLDPDKVQTLTLPTTPADLGGQGGAVLLLDRQQAEATLDLVRGTPGAAATTSSSTAAPSTTVAGTSGPLQVLNGTAKKGAAAGAASQLRGSGFTVTATGDAAPAGRTVIRYGAGAQGQAETLAATLRSGARLQSDAAVKAGSVVLVIGDDYDGVGGRPGPGAATTTTAPAPAPTPVPADAAPRRGC